MRYLGTREIPIAELAGYPGNPRVHDRAVLEESARVNGQYRSVVAREIEGPDGTTGLQLLAGHGTVAAFAATGAAAVRVEVIAADDTEARRIVVVDNRAGDLAGYDDTLLAALLDGLDGAWPGTGWDEDALAALTASLDSPGPGGGDSDEDEDDVPAPPADPVTRPGDVWILGPHRLICGDTRDPATHARLLDGATVNLAVSSPPYADRREYDTTSGFTPIRPDDYVDWFAPVAANLAAHLAEDGSWFLNIKPGITPDGDDTELYVFDLVLAHVREWGWHFATEFCWERTGVPKSVTRRFKNQFEPVYQFTRGRWKMRPDEVRHASEFIPIPGGPGVGDTGWANAQGGNGPMFGARKRKNGTRKAVSDVQCTAYDVGEFITAGLAYPGNRLPTFTGSHTATGHTAAFPVGLPAWFIRAYTDPGDTVLDPFAGSGSTLIAAQQTGRTGYGVEISPGYCDVICARFQSLTGILPVREADGAGVDFTPTT